MATFKADYFMKAFDLDDFRHFPAILNPFRVHNR